MLLEIVASSQNKPDGYLERKLDQVQINMTAQLAIRQPDQISAINRQSPEAIENLMIVMLSTLQDSFSVKNKMTPAALNICAQTLIKKYWYLRPEELLYCFGEARNGTYGTAFNRIDQPTVMEWIRTYDLNDRDAVVEQARQAALEEEKAEQEETRLLLEKPIYPNPGELTFLQKQMIRQAEKTKADHEKEIALQKFKLNYDEDQQKRASPF